MQPVLIEVYRSRRRAECNERGLVLTAVGIDWEIASLGDGYALLVAEQSLAAALAHLQAYGDENRSVPARPRLPEVPVNDDAWLGSAAYAIVLIAIAHLAAGKALSIDWFVAGELPGHAAIGGQWWRAVTALTLHADSAHLLANLGFGALFGYLLGQLIGPGVAWASILAAGALGNIADALAAPDGHRVIGASTAVFATLGLLAAYSWRIRRSGGPGADRRSRWPYRWSPLIAAAALLAFTGTGGERTDVLAHASGFASGAALGVLYGRLAMPLASRRRLQQIAGAAALLVVACAWALAII